MIDLLERALADIADPRRAVGRIHRSRRGLRNP